MTNSAKIFSKRLLGAAILSAALITPAIASAQDYAPAGQDQQIQGTVASINGTWNLTVADANGYAIAWTSIKARLSIRPGSLSSRA